VSKLLQESRFLDFGAFRVDRAKGVLLRDGAPVALSPKAFGTLLRLLKEPGQVVTKAELMESVWPDAIVEENNLTQAVSALRKALGDANGEPQVVVGGGRSDGEDRVGPRPLRFRPHQALGGATPAEIYFGRAPSHLSAIPPPRGRPGEGSMDSPFRVGTSMRSGCSPC
jgi:hypothetical protein